MNLLATSLAALFFSLGALAMLAAGITESTVWRIVSGGGLVTTLYFAMRSIRRVVTAAGSQAARNTAVLLAINLPLLAVCAAQVWNLIALGEFWPVFVLLVALFAIGCFSFTRLIFARSA